MWYRAKGVIKKLNINTTGNKLLVKVYTYDSAPKSIRGTKKKSVHDRERWRM